MQRLFVFLVAIPTLCCSARAQDLKIEDIEFSWHQNYLNLAPLSISWKFEDIIHDAFHRQEWAENRKDSSELRAQSAIYWHTVAIAGNNFQHRSVAGERMGVDTPKNLGSYPLLEEMVKDWNTKDLYRCEIDSKQGDTFIKWAYTPVRRIHFFDEKRKSPARSRNAKTGLFICNANGLRFQLPMQDQLRVVGSEAKFQSMDNGSIRLILIATETETNGTKFGSIVEWTLDPAFSLLPTHFTLAKFRGDPDVEEKVIVQSGVLQLKKFGDNCYIDRLKLDFFNNVKNLETHEFEYQNVRSHVYQVADIRSSIEPEMLTFSKPPGAVGVNTETGELELTDDIRSQIASLGDELPSNSPFISGLILLIAFVFVAVVVAVKVTRRTRQLPQGDKK